MVFFFPTEPWIRRNLIIGEVEKFRKDHPDGIDGEIFAASVEAVVKKLRDSGGNHPADVEIDKRKDRKISERTIRYYRARGWIADPYRRKGRGARYHEIHLMQMLAAHRLRLDEAPEADIEKVARMGFDECLGIVIGEEVERSLPSAASCDALQLILVCEEGNSEALQVARSVASLARRSCRSLIQVSVHETEIYLEKTTGADEGRKPSDGVVADKETDSEEGDGRIRKQIQSFRRQHRIDDGAFVQILTSRSHELNWFADWGATHPRDGVLHLGEYQCKLEISQEAVIASYALLLAICGELAGRGVSPYSLFHRDRSRGCLFDFCDDGRDLPLKLLSGDICSQCLDRMAPVFTTGLMREVASFLDAIRGRVRALQQFAPDPETRLREILRSVYVHALIEANSPGREDPVSLPQAGEDLNEWVFESRIGEDFGVSGELESLARLAGKARKGEQEDDEWAPSRNAVLGALGRLHPDLRFVRIDSIGLNSGVFIVKGTPLEGVTADSWDFSFDRDLSALGITDTPATYAKFGEAGSSPRFVNVDDHLRIVDEGGKVRAVLRLPDGTLVDYADGVPLSGCKAFSEKEKDSEARESTASPLYCPTP